MARPEQDSYSPIRDEELAEKHRVLNGWRKIDLFDRVLVQGNLGDDEPPEETEEARVIALARANYLEAMTIAIARPPVPRDPDVVLRRFREVLADRHRDTGLELMRIVVAHIRATGQSFYELPERLKRMARFCRDPLEGAAPPTAEVDAAIAAVFAQESVASEIEYSLSRGARAATAALQGIALSKLSNDFKRMKKANWKRRF